MVRNLTTFIVSLFFLTACSTASNNKLEDKALSNEDTVSKGVVEEESHLDVIKIHADTSVALLHDEVASHDSNVTLDSNTQSDSKQDSNSNTNTNTEAESVENSQADAKLASEDSVEAGSEKGIGSYFLRNNTPTQKVIKSLEGVTDALNVMTFGIFATGHG
ncbi:hypothetical protein BCU69_12455 [Vibrio cyclitrophicus]|uniref:hypothetical protein n=1 Tax=Vibrio cyclitrophicus TaxID=47951 RepID=UPI000C849726|nr:hypothetical protein [Vibrio cyclitrophicus]NOH19006.1 hypothetical protein [Vibrio cyclitrophicus]PMH41480.1 hypothetical protein BCU69_12455 [Vibrio cyclitrophicus]